MKKKYSQKHVFNMNSELLKIEDRTYMTNEGRKCTIINGGSKVHYVTIQIEDWISEVPYKALKKGSVKYPYHPSVYGKGYFGIGEYSQVTHKKIYFTWKGMLERVYNLTCQSKYPTYKGVGICTEWHNFQLFARWMKENYVESFELDKDLLASGNKLYSPQTCIFIPQRLNSFLIKYRSSNTSGHTQIALDSIK